MSNNSIEVITSTSRCQEVSLELRKEAVIAIDAEGVQLGKDGPMTLLQIGTLNGKVYLIDVQENRNVFAEGGLAYVLGSDSVVKVIHSSKGDSAALFFQFQVKLRNVFDTQIAHLVIEESNGRRLPTLLKLSVLCEQYSSTSRVAENKEDVSEIFKKEVGDFWARRPLTDNMIEYAAGDVLALLPEVYENQKRVIEEKNLWDKFQERVEEEIMLEIDENIRRQRRERVEKTVNEVLHHMEQKYTDDIRFSDITDEDNIKALQRMNFQNTDTFSPLIQRLKTESIKAKLQELKDQIQEEGSSLCLTWRVDKFLYRLLKHPDEDIVRDAKHIRGCINEIFLKDINKKYNLTTTLDMVSNGDKDALRSMFPKGSNDKQYSEIQLRLYWLITAEDIKQHGKIFLEKKREFTLSEGYEKRLKYFISGDVPSYVKSEARNFMRSLDREFGRGCVPRPPRK